VNHKTKTTKDESCNSDQTLREEVMAQREEIEAHCDPAHFKVFKRMASNPENYLVVSFGGGGLPGIAGNIALQGLLDELEIRPDVKEIWGSSAGAAIGGTWSTGASLNDTMNILNSMNKKSVDMAIWEIFGKGIFKMFFLKKLPEGLTKGIKFRENIEKALKAKTFEETLIPFRAIACTDDGHARKVIFRSGPLIDAIMASMCLPGLSWPIQDWNGKPYGYFDGGMVEKTPLPSIIEDHLRAGRKSKLIIVCTRFSNTQRVTKPVGFLSRFVSVFDTMAETIWEAQLIETEQASNCTQIILNPRLPFGSMLDFDSLFVNYLWSRKMFKEQLSNAKLVQRFDAH
jgi:predicted acylesterase/phospholipase RssA